MAFSNPQYNSKDATKLRKEAGKYLKRIREEAELTQLELAKHLGLDYPQMVSHCEIGKTRVPPDKIMPWALAVGKSPREVAAQLLHFYDPYMWNCLFGGKVTSSRSKTSASENDSSSSSES